MDSPLNSINRILCYSFRVLIGIENGFVDLICSIRYSNFIVLNDQRVYYEHQSLSDKEPSFREYNLTYEDFNFGNSNTMVLHE